MLQAEREAAKCVPCAHPHSQYAYDQCAISRSGVTHSREAAERNAATIRKSAARARGSRDDGRAMNYASSGRAGFSLFDVSVAADPQTRDVPRTPRRRRAAAARGLQELWSSSNIVRCLSRARLRLVNAYR